MSINRFPIKTVIFLLFVITSIASAQDLLNDDPVFQEQEIRSRMLAQQQQEVRRMQAQYEEELQRMRAQYEEELQRMRAQYEQAGQQQANAQQEQADFDQRVEQSKQRVLQRYPDASDINSDFSKKMVEIRDRLEREGNPVIHQTAAHQRIADMAAGALGISPMQ
jgi:chromosome segregation ATPase